MPQSLDAIAQEAHQPNIKMVRFYNIEELAEAFKVSTRTISREHGNGLHVTKIRSNNRYMESQAVDYIYNNKYQPKTEAPVSDLNIIFAEARKYENQLPLMDIEAAAKLLQVSIRSVRRYIAEGEMPAFSVGNQVRFNEAIITAYLKYNERRQTSQLMQSDYNR